MPLTDSAEQALANGLLGDPDYTSPDTVYVGLSTTTPTATGSNFTEPVGNGYARVAASWDAAAGSAPAEKITDAAVQFPTATAAWGTVTHYGFFAASSGGSPFLFEEMDEPLTVVWGDVLWFPIGELLLRVGFDRAALVWGDESLTWGSDVLVWED